MKYLFTLWGDESDYETATPEEGAAEMAAYEAFGREAEAAGILLGGEGLEPTTSATTLRLKGGERVVTDGPFAETKEQLGGYYVLDCKDLDDALDWAAKLPVAKSGSVEIRPIMDYEAVAKGYADAANAQNA